MADEEQYPAQPCSFSGCPTRNDHAEALPQDVQPEPQRQLAPRSRGITMHILYCSCYCTGLYCICIFMAAFCLYLVNWDRFKI